MYRSEYSANVALATSIEGERVSHTTPDQQLRDALTLAECNRADDAVRSDRMRSFLFA